MCIRDRHRPEPGRGQAPPLPCYEAAGVTVQGRGGACPRPGTPLCGGIDGDLQIDAFDVRAGYVVYAKLLEDYVDGITGFKLDTRHFQGFWRDGVSIAHGI